MAEQFQNFFVTKLREACNSSATTIYVETVPSITEGTLVLEYANSTKHEIIHFTGVSGYGLTGCTRGLEGTTAQSHSAGTDVRQNLTAGMIDKLSKMNNVYSTEEQVVGKWVDGKTIYRKTIDFGQLPNINNKQVNINVTNIDRVVSFECIAISNTGQKRSIPIPFGATNDIFVMSYPTYIQIGTTSDRSEFDAYVTIFYTKT